MLYLSVPYREKDEAKALGARWDRDAASWYVPTGMDRELFSKWLPVSAQWPVGEIGAAPIAPTESEAGSAVEVQKGVSLSRLLAGVAAAVAAAYREGVWVRAEVMRVDARNANVYLELSERNAEGEALATGRGFIPARTANRILPEFQRATGVTIGPGIKVLVRAKPIFHPRWGLSLEIDSIDPTFTLGDMAARLREIRLRLQREGIFETNKQLEAPEDFDLVLVVAPEEAAGLGDFKADSDVLQRHAVCRFVYAHSRFQGEGSAADILAAARQGLDALERQAGRLPDCVVIIRGGGAVNDLAWLNDYELARWVCECPVPVFSGIGHERDNTIVDEVAHTRFDTPSKVIAGIRDRIAMRTRSAVAAFQCVTGTAARLASHRRQHSERLIETVKAGAVEALHRARLDSERLDATVRSGAREQLASARRQVPALFADVRAGSTTGLAQARGNVDRLLAVSRERAMSATAQARSGAATHVLQVQERAQTLIEAARKASEGLLREIMGQGPQRTLARGFGLVRDHDGRAVSRVAGVAAGDNLNIELADGQLSATVTQVQSAPTEPKIS